MAIDLEEMLVKIKDRQWALADIEWDAAGAETLTAEQRPKLKAFMADLRWIEDGEMPEPNINIRLAIEWLDRWADDMPLGVLGTVIPMLEVALDGALVKFLVDEVHDPVCHQVFAKINADESRHLAVDFQVLDILGALMYIPLLNRMRNNIAEIGLDEQRLYNAMARSKNVGERSANIRRLPLYQTLKWHAGMVVNRRHPYHLLADSMETLSAHYPKRLLRPIPNWFNELTYEPAA